MAVSSATKAPDPPNLKLVFGGLECWQPEQHPDLARVIDRLAREFFVDDSALRGRMQTPAPAGAAS